MENKPSVHYLEYRTLFNVLLVLMVFTGITVGASFLDLGKLNVWIALFIASIKASFVLLFFMHMKYEGPLLKISFLGTVFFLAVMISFTFWDIAFR
jgi:cytochrome c oxidase subunit 4